MNNKTFIPSNKKNTCLNRKWYVIDCTGQSLGRTSSTITKILQGKHKVMYTPSTDMGDYVILINAMDLTLGDVKGHTYVFQPGRPGSSLSFKEFIDDIPERVIENCIKNMMAEGPAKRAMSKRLKIYATSDHPHMAQNPILLSNADNIFTLS